jgi:GT2 family glycosyltransferase
MDRSLVSVVIINYNSSRFTLGCVESVRVKTKQVNLEIIVVDNGSLLADWSALQPLANLPGLTLVRSRINLGFSGGNMLGWQFVNPEADYYFFLNNDCELRTDVCSQLADFMAQTPDAGASSGQMIEPDGSFSRQVRYFPTPALYFFGPWIMNLIAPSEYPDRNKLQTKPQPSPVLSGSALFIRASVFGAIGGFDIGYFLYCEEEDICQKLKKLGLRVYIVPDAEYVHFGGQSTKRDLAISREYYISLFRYYRHHHSALARVLMQVILAIKNARKFYRSPNFLWIAGFILQGAPERSSLRHNQQTIQV